METQCCMWVALLMTAISLPFGEVVLCGIQAVQRFLLSFRGGASLHFTVALLRRLRSEKERWCRIDNSGHFSKKGLSGRIHTSGSKNTIKTWNCGDVTFHDEKFQNREVDRQPLFNTTDKTWSWISSLESFNTFTNTAVWPPTVFGDGIRRLARRHIALQSLQVQPGCSCVNAHMSIVTKEQRCEPFLTQTIFFHKMDFFDISKNVPNHLSRPIDQYDEPLKLEESENA